MAITRYAGDRFTIGAGETKPTGVLDGAVLIDTGNLTQHVKRTVAGTSQWSQIAGGGGGGSPGGTNTQVQFNNTGAFGGDADLTFTDGNRLNVNKLGISGNIYDSNNSIGDNGMVLTNEGTTGVNWKAIEDVLSGVGGSGVANYVARWADEDTLTTGVLVDNGTNVGINVPSPNFPLEISSSSNATVRIEDTTNNSRLDLRAEDSAVLIRSTSNFPMRFDVNQTERMRIDTAGNVGIGTNDPLAKLVVKAAIPTVYAEVTPSISSALISIANLQASETTNDQAQLQFNVTGGSYNRVGSIGLIAESASNRKGALVFTTDDAGTRTEKMRIAGDGNVGIGITSPNAKLHIAGSGGDVKFTIDRTDARTYSIYTESNSSLSIKDEDASADRLTILSDGNVGIGTAVPSQKLHVQGNLRVTGAYYASDNNAGSSNQVLTSTGSGGTDWKSLSQIGGVTGSGTSNKLPLWDGTSSLTDSIITQSSTSYVTVFGGFRVSGNHTDTGSQLNLWCDSSGHGKLAVYDMQFLTGSNSARNNTALFLKTDGGTVAPSQKLHVQGTLRLTGAFYDSNNAAGTSGQVLTSTGSATDWKDLDEISGVTASNPTTTNYVTKWSDGTNEVITDSLIYDDGTSVGIGTSTLSEALTVNGRVEAEEFIGDLRGAVVFKANAGENISKGQAVYISGISGNKTVVSLADANDASKMPAFGVAAKTASASSDITIVTFGRIDNLDTSSYTEGDELFVSTTAGALTDTPPAGESALLQKLAKVTRSDNSAGSMTVMGAGRTNAVPNLNEGHLFVGNASNQAVSDNTLHVDIANSKVGIGTAIPTYKLHVVGDGLFTDDLNIGIPHANENQSSKLFLNKSVSGTYDFITLAATQNNGSEISRIVFKNRYGTSSFSDGQEASYIASEKLKRCVSII